MLDRTLKSSYLLTTLCLLRTEFDRSGVTVRLTGR